MRRLLLLGLVSVLAGACAGGPSVIASGDDRDALLAFTRCMRERGVALADPVIEGDSVKLLPAEGAPMAPRERFEAAQKACREHLPPDLAGLGTDETPADVREREEAALRFADCVREEGFDVPDPRFENGRVVNWDPAALGIDLDDPQVQRVAEACTERSGYDPRDG